MAVSASSSSSSKGATNRKAAAPKGATSREPKSGSKANEISVTGSATPGLLTLSKAKEANGSKSKSKAGSRKAGSSGSEKKNTSKASGLADESEEDASEAILISSSKSRRGPQVNAIAADEQQLSQSAPLPSAPLSRKNRELQKADAQWSTPQPSEQASVTPLNWQQQLLSGANSSSSTGTGTKNGKSSRKNKAQREDDRSDKEELRQLAGAPQAADALTWQQELFNAAYKGSRGPQHDVFADARDAQTFGDSSGGEDRPRDGKGRGRRRSGSLGNAQAPSKNGRGKQKKAFPIPNAAADISLDDVFASSPSKHPHHTRLTSLPANSGGAGTPAKRAAAAAAAGPQHSSSPATSMRGGPSASGSASSLAAAAAAYAGPDFHNSPSAASLPVPKFGSRQSKAPSNAASNNDATQTALESSTPVQHGDFPKYGGSGANDPTEGDTTAPARTRGSTAPPATTTAESGTPAHSAEQTTQSSSTNKPATVENLLARLMSGASL
ncbi:unnamed protein product [Jaminaea pallidilutea]